MRVQSTLSTYSNRTYFVIRRQPPLCRSFSFQSGLSRAQRSRRARDLSVYNGRFIPIAPVAICKGELHCKQTNELGLGTVLEGQTGRATQLS